MFPLIVLLSIQVFGIQLGAEFNAPPCPANPTLTTTVCIEPVDKSGWSAVVFPLNYSPAIVANNKLSVFVVDGKIEAVDFQTYGTRTQSRDLATLKAWFGEPESTTYRQNLGESSETIDAVWNKPEVKIWFRGNLGGKNGIVRIHTAKGQKPKS